VAVSPGILVVAHVEGGQVARCSDVATRGGGGATQRHSKKHMTACASKEKKKGKSARQEREKHRFSLGYGGNIQRTHRRMCPLTKT
jgi:hypothetical protein